jgi:hypothetical protein
MWKESAVKLVLCRNVSVLLLALWGCAHRPEPKGSELRPHKDGFQVRLIDLRYDRRSLKGALLVSPKGAGTTIDNRIVEGIHFVIVHLRDCATGEETRHLIQDYLLEDDASEHLLHLESEFWFGAPIAFEWFNEPGPACLDVDAEYRPLADPALGAQAVHFRLQSKAQ